MSNEQIIQKIKTALNGYPEEFDYLTTIISDYIGQLKLNDVEKRHNNVFGKLKTGEYYVKYSYVVDIFREIFQLANYSGMVGKTQIVKEFKKYLVDNGVNITYRSVPYEHGVSLICLADKETLDALIDNFIESKTI